MGWELVDTRCQTAGQCGRLKRLRRKVSQGLWLGSGRGDGRLQGHIPEPERRSGFDETEQAVGPEM